jgi:hypothetical protein
MEQDVFKHEGTRQLIETQLTDMCDYLFDIFQKMEICKDKSYVSAALFNMQHELQLICVDRHCPDEEKQLLHRLSQAAVNKVLLETNFIYCEVNKFAFSAQRQRVVELPILERGIRIAGQQFREIVTISHVACDSLERVKGIKQVIGTIVDSVTAVSVEKVERYIDSIK